MEIDRFAQLLYEAADLGYGDAMNGVNRCSIKKVLYVLTSRQVKVDRSQSSAIKTAYIAGYRMGQAEIKKQLIELRKTS